jgi:integrase
LHDIRHAAATTMMERGVHPSVVSKSLGHANEAFTMAVYGHVRDEMLDQAANALGDAYGERA